jgi:hypothetical protein
MGRRRQNPESLNEACDKLIQQLKAAISKVPLVKKSSCSVLSFIRELKEPRS